MSYEIVGIGDQEIVGGPDDEYASGEDEYMSGADISEIMQYASGGPAGPTGRPALPPHPSQMRRGRPVAYAEDNQVRVINRRPTKPRQFPIGFIEEVEANDEVDITVNSQVLFRGERLAVATSIARFFHIVDIKVGKNSQLAASGEMPAESFDANAVGVRMELDTATTGMAITLRVRNVTADRQSFKAVLYGSVVEP
jgi:hypothetical protein